MKRTFALLLSLTLLISCLPLSALATNDSEKLEYTLSVGGETVISVQPGEEIEVDFIMKNVAGESFEISNYQGQIKYDKNFFEFFDDPSSVDLVKASSFDEQEKSLGTKVIDILGSHYSYGQPATYEPNQLIARVRFKVKEGLSTGTSGELSFFPTTYSAANAMCNPILYYEINAKSMMVFIGEPPTQMHTVTYKNGDATVSTETHAANSVITINHGPVGETDKKFIGWEDESGNLWQFGDQYTVMQDTTFTAKWASKYTLHFETNGGSAIPDKVEWEDIDIVLSEYTTTKNGNTFAGWYEDAACTIAVTSNFKLSGDKTIYAKWTENAPETFTLTFNTNGGSSILPITQNKDTIISLSGYTPTKDGYTFSGWYADSTLETEITSITLTADTTIYAKWTENATETFTLTFNTNGGSSILPITQNKNTVISLSGYMPTKDGYDFSGWYTDSTLTTKVTSITLTANTTIYAKWSKKDTGGGGGGGGFATTEKYTLSFETNGGKEIKAISVSGNTAVDLAKYVPEKEGYIFKGWYSDNELINQITEIKLSANTTIYAKWEKADGETPVVKPDYKPSILTDEHYAYIVGREGGMIAPERDITRAEVSTIIYRLLDEEVRNKAKTKENVFTDVNEDDWFNAAVSTLASLELVNGRTTDTFAPNAFITRAELATIFARMAEINYGGKVLFSDVSGHWAEGYINEAATAEWIVGYNGLFRPDDNITRAEVMTLVNRVLNREPESKDDLLDGMTTFGDNANEDAWYYLAVQEATNSHTYEMKADGKHEKWTSLKENPDWSKLED